METVPEGPRSARRARGRAVRDQARDRRPGRDARAAARRAAGRRPRAARGRARPGQDADRQDARRRARREFRRVQFTPDLVPPTSSARASTGPTPALRHRARPGVRQLPARRRDQPRAGQGPVRPARGDAGAPGDDRRHDLPVPKPFLVHGHAEPDRVRGHLPAARGPGRPVPVQADRRLPDRRRGGGRRRPRDRPAGRGPRAPLGRGPRALSAGRRRCSSTAT